MTLYINIQIFFLKHFPTHFIKLLTDTQLISLLLPLLIQNKLPQPLMRYRTLHTAISYELEFPTNQIHLQLTF